MFGLDGFKFADPTSGDPNADDRPSRLWIEDYLDSVPGNQPIPPTAASAATAVASGAALAAMSAGRGSRAAMLTRVFHEDLNAFVEIDDMKQLEGIDGGVAAAGLPGGEDDLLLVDGDAEGGGSADSQGPAVNWEGDFSGFAPSP